MSDETHSEPEVWAALERTHELLRAALPGLPPDQLAVTLDNLCARLFISCIDEEAIRSVRTTLRNLEAEGRVRHIILGPEISGWVATTA